VGQAYRKKKKRYQGTRSGSGEGTGAMTVDAAEKDQGTGDPREGGMGKTGDRKGPSGEKILKSTPE